MIVILYTMINIIETQKHLMNGQEDIKYIMLQVVIYLHG